MNQRQKVQKLYDDAACADTNPKVFDAVQPPYTIAALKICNRCTVMDICKDIIQPERNFYEGTVAGRTYVHGRDITYAYSIKETFASIIPIERATQARDERASEQDELISTCSCGAWTSGTERCTGCQ
jgi:hypothetical protein